jgi:serine/threonine protein kinase
MSSTSMSTYSSSTSLKSFHTSSSKSLSNNKNDTILNSKSNWNLKKISIEDFEFIKELGQGSYGKVILGIHKETGKKYAIKVIDKFIIDKLEKTHEIFIERDMLTKILNHPNIIKFNYVFQNKKKIFFIEELYLNGSLQNLIERNKIISEKLIKFYLGEILNVLSYFEEKKIAHRDIKPDNILLDDNDHLKFIDFATATKINSIYDMKKRIFKPRENEKCELLGTLEYCSPEMLKGKVKNEKSCDIWSFGIIIYQLYHSYTPFKGKNDDETKNNILYNEITFKDNLNENVKDLIIQCLNKNDNERIGIKSIMEIKNHIYFDGFDFENLFEKKVPSVYDDETLLDGNNLLNLDYIS